MAHQVTCVYCKGRFDRDKEQYVATGARRYAHAACALRKAHEDGTPAPEVINPLDNVICVYCKKPLNRNDEDCVALGDGKYAHKDCLETENNRELTDQEKLERYIMKLFNENYVNQRIKQQINSFIKNYNFTYSGILKSLVYFYEVKGNSLEKANGGIGIVPYVYKDAYNYYYSIWEAKQKTEYVTTEDLTAEEVIVHIPIPQRKIKTRKLFTFLDEEETDGE